MRRNFDLGKPEDVAILKKYKRVWFTREYDDDDSMLIALDMGKTVAIEIHYEFLKELPAPLRDRAQIYVVLDQLRPTDLVKLGDSFSEIVVEVKKIQGPRSNPGDYCDDVRIK